MKVLVTGASGFVGAHVLAELQRAGHAATAALMPDEDAATLAARVADFGGGGALGEARVRWEDPAEFEPLLEEHPGVIHLVGWMRGDDRETYEHVNVGLVRLLMACRGWTDEHRLVHLSSVAALGPGTPEEARGEAAASRRVGLYGETKQEGEYLVGAAPRPARRMIVRAPSIYGPGDPSFRDAFLAALEGRYPALGPRDLRFQLVYAPDLARALVRALGRLGEDPPPPRTLHVGNPEVLTHEAWATCFAEALGRDVSVLSLGTWGTWLYGQWGACKGWLTGEPQLVGRDKVAHLLAGDWVHSFALQDEVLPGLAWTPHPEATRATLEWYRRERRG